VKKKKSPPAKPNVIDLPPRSSIAQCVDLHRTLTSCCNGEAPLVLDGSRVEEIDTAILQLLVSAWLGGAKRGVECRWQGASEALRHSATLIGVAVTLQLDGMQVAGAAAAPARALGAV
jgi:anti-anti-sigma regulatory factor